MHASFAPNLHAHAITSTEYGPLKLLEIPYIDFANQECTGHMLVHPGMAVATQAFFTELHRRRFPIFSMICGPWKPEEIPPLEMRLFNTIGYVDKKRQGKTSPSHHCVGLAFDLNPHLNPFVWEAEDKRIPPFSYYNPDIPGTITEDIITLAESLGFLSGARWLEKKDYMHFSWKDCESLIPGLKPELPGAVFA